MSWTRIACTVALSVAATMAAWAADVSGIALDTGAKATIGTKLTIQGTGFGVKKPKVVFQATDGKHGSRAAKVLSSSDTEIVAQVTSLYPIAKYAGPYDVQVVPGDKGSVASVVQGGLPVDYAHLSSVTPFNPVPGQVITIHGSLFGTKKGKVKLNNKAAKVSSWTDTTIVAKLNKKSPVGGAVLLVTNKLGNTLSLSVMQVVAPTKRS